MKREDFIKVLVERTTFTKTCWIWHGSIVRNYPQWPRLVNGKHWYAHRLSYWFFEGCIPAGMTVNHMCRNTLCVNPDHLELMTRSENARDVWAQGKWAECAKGHLIDGENAGYRNNRTYPRCKECAREYTRAYRARVKGMK